MKITILGSGTGWPRLERGAPGYLLQIERENILLDFGPGTIGRLLKVGITINDLDVICLSHFHPDHITDLIPFLFATRYALGYTRRRAFKLLAGEGFRTFYETLKGAFGSWVEPPAGLMEIQELSTRYPSAFLLPPFEVRTAPMQHNPESIAFRFDYQGKSFVYSGDTDFTPQLIELAQEADLLIIECSAPEGEKIPGHLTPTLAGRIAGEARVRRLVLSHLYPPCDASDIISPCQRFFAGEIILAKDFLTLEI